ncbi:DUF5043 domain-containing protein [Bacteroides intestinalis]|jgi:hypothetical protein|nr:DUF5043 domain-containing protein [Bacteroides intestinalis]
MKTLLFTISILLLGITEGFSQTLKKLYYYEETKTFVESGYAYQCDVLH